MTDSIGARVCTAKRKKRKKKRKKRGGGGGGGGGEGLRHIAKLITAATVLLML